jgi:hypothetical protein
MFGVDTTVAPFSGDGVAVVACMAKFLSLVVSLWGALSKSRSLPLSSFLDWAFVVWFLLCASERTNTTNTTQKLLKK